MAWIPPVFTPGVVWQDTPSTATPLSAADLNLEASSEAGYAASVGTSLASYVGDADPAAGQDVLVFNGTRWARVPVGGTDQRMIVRSDGTVGYETPQAISARAWNVRPANSSATNTTNLQAAITQATQNNGRGPGGNLAGGRIDLATGTYTISAALLMKFGVKLYGVGGQTNTVIKADNAVPLSGYQNGTRVDPNGNKVPALIRWDGGDQWAHGVHVVGIQFDTSGIAGLSAMWFEATGENSWFDDLSCSSTAATPRTITDAQLVAGSNVVTVGSPPARIASTKTAALGANGGTTSAINTTGASLLVVALGAASAPVITDSLANDWTVITSGAARLAYAWKKGAGALATSSSHTVTVSGANTFPTIYFAAYSGTKTTSDPLDVSHVATNAATTIVPGSTTTTQNNDLVLTALSTSSTQGSQPTIDSGFAVDNWTDFSAGVNASNATASLILRAPGVINPTWTTANGAGNAAIIAAFKAAPSANSFTEDDVNAIVTMGGVVTAPATPVPTAGGGGGTVPTATYNVGVTYLTASGETPISATASVSVTLGQQVTVPSPPATAGATGWFAYMDDGNGGRLVRQQPAGSPSSISVSLVISSLASQSGATPYTKVDQIGWAANSNAASVQNVVLSQPAAATLSNVTLTIARPTDAFVFQGAVPGRFGKLHGVNNSGALLRLKNYGGVLQVDQLSGDDNVGGMARISLAARSADPAFVAINSIKAESDTYNPYWQYSHDPVILIDRCWTVGVNVNGGTFVPGAYARDLVRLDNTLVSATVGGPSLMLNGVEGQNWFNPQFANIVHDTQTGQAIPVTPYGQQQSYPTVFWNRRVLFGGGAMIHGNVSSVPYGTTVTPTSANGDWQTVTVTNGSAFTVAAPPDPPSSSNTAELTVEILNSSGGGMGVITWNGAFVFPTGSWTNPANGKKRFARFEWNGANWIATSVASADY